MLLIYYNVKTGAFYTKWIRGAYFNKTVGDVNNFDHILVQILVKNNTSFLNCYDFFDYLEKVRTKPQSTRNRIINKAICLLDKLKKE